MQLGPFEHHPAKPFFLEHRADALVTLAKQAADQEAVTDQAFDPAVASWDGLAAAELREAPGPIRTRAADVATRVAWAATPLRLWAERVRSYNRKVDDLLDEVGRVPADVERHIRERYPGSDTDWPLVDLQWEREWKRERLMDGLREQWRDAYQLYIDQGQDEVVGLLRHGPTWDNLELVRSAGLLPAGPLGQFLTVRWELTAAAQEAERIAGVILDPHQQPTREELERLAAILDQYAEDNEFSYLLLDSLGPDGYVELYGKVALLQPDGNYHPEAFDKELAALQASIQAGLATALATATTRRGTGGEGADHPYVPAPWELPPAWVDELMQVGRGQIELPVVNPSTGQVETVELYGYQLIGALLGVPGVAYDSDFLATVGADMIDFEMAAGWSAHGEGLPVWYDSWHRFNNPLDMEGLGVVNLPLRLNWVDGYDGDAPAGFDPMHGLMRALADDPATTRLLLGGDDPSRLEHLLTGRSWFPDVAGHYFWADAPQHLYPLDWGKDFSQDNPGHALLGRVLANAVTDEPSSAASIQIAEATVAVLGAGTGDLVPVRMRDSVAEVIATYITDINSLYRDASASVPGGHGAWSGDPVEAQPFLRKVLIDLGKDDYAARVIMEAQLEYVENAIGHYLTRADLTMDQRLVHVGNTMRAHAEIAAYLDEGVVRNWDEVTAAEVAAFNERLKYERAMIEAIVTNTLGSVPAAGRSFEFAADAAFAAIGDPEFAVLDDDERDELVAALKLDARIGMRELISVAVVNAFPLDDPAHEELLPGFPEELRDAKQEGRPWGDDEWDAWYRYLDDHPVLEDIIGNSLTDYLARFSG